MTTLDCVLLKDNNRALVAKSGPEVHTGFLWGNLREGDYLEDQGRLK